MSKKTLHPSIQKFKEFVKDHPKLINEVKEEKRTWQEIYEDWCLLGEKDEIWHKYKEGFESKLEKPEKPEKPDFMSTIISAMKGMDINQVQQHISTFGEAITSIQQLIGDLKGSNQQATSTSQHTHPFNFNKD